MQKRNDFEISLEQFIDSFPEAIYAKEVKKGEIVFVTMGSSHAPRIEKALQRSIK